MVSDNLHWQVPALQIWLLLHNKAISDKPKSFCCWALAPFNKSSLLCGSCASFSLSIQQQWKYELSIKLSLKFLLIQLKFTIYDNHSAKSTYVKSEWQCFWAFFWGYWKAGNGLAWGTLLGGEEYPNLRLGFVHIDDVVSAHLLAMEVPEAHGRYICSNEVAHFCDILEMLRHKYPNLQTASRLNYTFILLWLFFNVSLLFFYYNVPLKDLHFLVTTNNHVQTFVCFVYVMSRGAVWSVLKHLVVV